MTSTCTARSTHGRACTNPANGADGLCTFHDGSVGAQQRSKWARTNDAMERDSATPEGRNHARQFAFGVQASEASRALIDAVRLRRFDDADRALDQLHKLTAEARAAATPRTADPT